MKHMKLKCLAAAVLAIGASSAFAAASPTACDAATTAANFVNTCTPDMTMYIGGSSALAGAITQVAPADLFEAGSVTIVKGDASVPNYADTTGWYGVAKSTLGTAAGKHLYVVYNKHNGSAAGISQLLSTTKDTSIPEQDVVVVGPISKTAGVVAATQALSVGGANSCTQGSDSTLTVGATTFTFHNVTCTTHARTQADVGVSDVAPPYLFALEGAKPKALTTLHDYALGIQGFGIAVNAPLYNALQTANLAEGLIPATCSAGDLSAACQATIRRADYASLVTSEGSIKSAAGLLNNPSDTTLLKLERRDDYSGSQGSSNVFFASNPCLASVDSKGKTIKGVVGGELHILKAADSTASLSIAENATTQDIMTPLQDSNIADGYAIGVIGLNTTEPTRTSTSWKYVRLDGVSPNFNADGSPAHANRAPFANGNYQYAVTSYAATQIKPFVKTSVVTAYPLVVTALINGMQDSTLHDLSGIAYIDGAADPSSLDGYNKQAHYIHTDGNSCSPLVKN